MSSFLSELESIKFKSRLSIGEHSPKPNKTISQNPDLAVSFSITSSFFKELYSAKCKYPEFRYTDIVNSQLQSIQLKVTERLENRFLSKTKKVVSQNRKLTGRKRIAFDTFVHKVAVFFLMS